MYLVNADLDLELRLNKSVKEHQELFSTSLWFQHEKAISPHPSLSPQVYSTCFSWQEACPSQDAPNRNPPFSFRKANLLLPQWPVRGCKDHLLKKLHLTLN